MKPLAVNIAIPFESLLEAVKALDSDDQQKLIEVLETEIALAKEAQIEQDQRVQSEILDARVAYQAGDYLTLEEYTAKPDRND